MYRNTNISRLSMCSLLTQNTYKRYKWCDKKCCFTYLVNRTSQIVHMYGFSPVCVLMCRGSFPAPWMTLLQIGHCCDALGFIFLSSSSCQGGNSAPRWDAELRKLRYDRKSASSLIWPRAWPSDGTDPALMVPTSPELTNSFRKSPWSRLGGTSSFISSFMISLFTARSRGLEASSGAGVGKAWWSLVCGEAPVWGCWWWPGSRSCCGKAGNSAAHIEG